MTPPASRWPTRDAYDRAMLMWRQTLTDPELRSGELARDQFGIRRYGGAGLYTCVYRIDDWMVRCFRSNPPHEPPDDIEQRYAAVARCANLAAASVSALLPITYRTDGIRVEQRLLPIVTMPFLHHTTSLGRYIERYHDDASKMTALAAAWRDMIGAMEKALIAHGDLDLSNVLVEQTERGLLLRLIDYDNMWVPELRGRAQTEYGHEHFQHPAALPPHARQYDQDMDRFSALVIDISILALVAQPGLYELWGADESEQLLLTQADYREADRADGRIVSLAKIAAVAPLVDELRAALREERLPRSLLELGDGWAAQHDGNASAAAPAVASPQSPPLRPARPPIATFKQASRVAGVDEAGLPGPARTAQPEPTLPAPPSPVAPPVAAPSFQALVTPPRLPSVSEPKLVYRPHAPASDPSDPSVDRPAGLWIQLKVAVGMMLLLAVVVLSVTGIIQLSGTMHTAGSSAAAAAPTATLAPAPTDTPVVLYYTSMLDGNEDWSMDPPCFYWSDGYHLKTLGWDPAAYWCFAPFNDVSDGVISVQTVLESGGGSAYGLVFHVSGGCDYRYTLNADNTWSFVKEVNGDVSTILGSQNAYNMINTAPAAANRLAVEARGTHYEFFINGGDVGYADDGTCPSGATGVYAEDGLDVVFTYFMITA